jgi:hypothetical protein
MPPKPEFFVLNSPLFFLVVRCCGPWLVDWLVPICLFFSLTGLVFWRRRSGVTVRFWSSRTRQPEADPEAPQTANAAAGVVFSRADSGVELNALGELPAIAADPRGG